MKRVHFVSLGCPKNLVDTEIMLGSLVKQGYEVVEDPSQADTVVVNTCGFIEDAKKESIEKILEMAELKDSAKLKKLVVAGCLTQRYKGELVEGLPEADLFVGSGQFQNLAQILAENEAGSQQKTFFNLPTYLQEDATPRMNSQPHYRAYLKISEGCKKRCAFCAIPLIRGNLQSRGLKSILAEAKLLVAGGVKELTIISHDFTDFGWDLRQKDESAKESSVELLRALADESGAKWIRVLYLYPDGISKELVDLVASRPNLVKYFDMPLQHINNQMLKAMNRRMTRAEIEDAIRRIRQSIPEAVIRTQFIVGYPGETEEQFQELLAFVKQQRFDRVGCFAYSKEERTKAGQLPDQIEESVKQRRHDQLMQAQLEISRERHREMIGRRAQVIVEGVSEESELLLQGRTSQQAIDIDGITYINEGEAKVGDIVWAEIVDAHEYDLVARIVDSPEGH